MSTFYTRLRKPDSDYSVVVEDDGRVGYAYLLLEKTIIGDVWLYNQEEPPERPEWREKSKMPFLNPKDYAKAERFDPLTDEADVEAIWQDNISKPLVVEIYLRGRLFAIMSPGSKPGCSFLAAKNGPVAKVLTANADTEKHG